MSLKRDLIQKFVKKGRILDIGCNGGFFLSTFSNKYQKFGTEVDKQAVSYAKKNFPSFAKNIFYTNQLIQEVYVKIYILVSNQKKDLTFYNS